MRSRPARTPTVGPRPEVRGKFLYRGDEKLNVKGVTYGTFRPTAPGVQYPPPDVVARDFTRIARTGFNAVRTYTVPPRWLLDLAADNDLLVMVGIPWEHHVAFLEDRGRTREIEARVRAGVAASAGHPAVLAYTVGNEIPAQIVRWHGRRRVERYIERLCAAARSEDPGALVTYVNYPPTEYLLLPGVDFLCFNVYLERQADLEGYLARLHNLAGDHPLVMAEIGLDSRRNGKTAQARVLEWQLRSVFRAGCAGAFVFAWTDEWYVAHLSDDGRASGGVDVEDWEFGITDRDRRPKPAMAAIRRVLREVPLRTPSPAPRVSVVICTHDGARTLEDCLKGVSRLDYPDFEVIVVDDGSSDGTAGIAHDRGVRLISTANRGLASARNTGLHAATGSIVAYLDDDARPDPDWLTYLVAEFARTKHAGLCGPNVAPPGDGVIADCVANAPGGPTHVLISDTEAEHIPGCNMAFRREALQSIGGFDPQFRCAGDDVDVCWRLQDEGHTLGFSPAAMVWHHRRSSIRAYWRQQVGYGRAEALLERKWPHRYNAAGHPTWRGRVYGGGLPRVLGRWRVYYGTWGSRLFQPLYQPADPVSGLLRLPEWYLAVAALVMLGAAGALWPPLLAAFPVAAALVAAAVIHAGASAAQASFATPPRSAAHRLALLALTALLHLLQPLARLRGRLALGLAPWRFGGPQWARLARSRGVVVWSERWRAAEDRLQSLEARLQAQPAPVRRGGSLDRWDLEVRGGSLGGTRLRLAAEEHGAGRQLVRIRSWPRSPAAVYPCVAVLAALALLAAFSAEWLAAGVLAGLSVLVALVALAQCGVAASRIARALEQEGFVRRRPAQRPEVEGAAGDPLVVR